MVNLGHEILPEEREQIERLVRFEGQVKKRGIYNMKLPTRRSLKPFLEYQFCSDYVLKEAYSIFGTAPYVGREKALEAIQNSQYRPFDKAVMESIIDTIPRFWGLHELEKAVEEGHAPAQYGNSLRAFRQRWLKKFQQLGIQPVVIPDDFGIDEMPSIYELLKGEVQ